jgi:cytochrome c oxidase subunit I
VAIAPSPGLIREPAVQRGRKGALLLRLLHTTDHKTIGNRYLVTSFVFFMIGGVMALLMRASWAGRGCSSSRRSSTTSCSPCTARS